MYRHCAEVIGYAYDGELYCPTCVPRHTDEALESPVFLGDEYPHCGDVCGACLEYLDGHEPQESEEE